MATHPTLSSIELEFLTTARTAVLATIGDARRPRLVPICFAVAATAAGLILYSPIDEKPKQSDDPRALGRVRDIAANPAVSVLVDRWSEEWSRLGWLRVEGTAQLLEPTDGVEHAAAVTALRTKYPQYATHDLGARPIIRIVVERTRSWGDLDPA